MKPEDMELSEKLFGPQEEEVALTNEEFAQVAYALSMFNDFYPELQELAARENPTFFIAPPNNFSYAVN